MLGITKKKSKKPATPKPKKKNDVSYGISPTNYLILSPDEKTQVLRSFINVIRSIEKKLQITIVNQTIHTTFAGKDYDYVEKMAYFTSRQDLGVALLGTGFKSTRQDEPIAFKVAKEKRSHLEMVDGTFWRTYVIYDFSRKIEPAWVNQLSAICDMTNVSISPMKVSSAKRMLVTHANTLESTTGKRQHQEAADAREVVDMLVKNQTSVYECGITAVVTATSRKELKSRCREFERNAKMRQIKFLAVNSKQKDTLDGWGHKFLFEEMSCSVFYPFESSDMIEADGAGGVYIGTNELTGTPVIYDYLNRTNYNMTILGSSGFGKSVAAKTYIDNFYAMIAEKYGPDQKIMSYILDLHGEYVELAGYLKMDVMDLMGRGEMGLDPFTLLESSDMAVDLITDVANMPPELKSLTLSMAGGVRSISEMVRRLENDSTDNAEDCRKASTYLLQFVKGGLAKMFGGEMKIKDRTIIAMRKATESDINSMLIALTMQKIWMDIISAPRHVSKLLVIEEAWFVLRLPSTAAILSNIARSGRKENLHLIVMTHDIDDFLQNEYGAAILKNSATVFLLGLKASTAKTLQEVLDLSDNERDEITYLDKGQAIMRADRNRVKLKVKPTPEQLKIFNTAASGFVPTGD